MHPRRRSRAEFGLVHIFFEISDIPMASKGGFMEFKVKELKGCLCYYELPFTSLNLVVQYH